MASATERMRQIAGLLERMGESLTCGQLRAIADDVDALAKATRDMTYGLPDLLESIGYTDEEGMVDKALAALAKVDGDPA